MQPSPHDKATRLAALGYLLLFLGLLFGVAALLGAIISHTHLHKTRGSIAKSHLTLQLAVFWIIVVLISGVLIINHPTAVWWFGVAAATLWLTTLVTGATLLARRQAITLWHH